MTIGNKLNASPGTPAMKTKIFHVMIRYLKV